MDVVAHGLWAGAASKAANKKLLEPKGKKPLNVWRAAWWGVFPDMFAFAIPWIWLGVDLARGAIAWSDIPGPENAEPPPADTYPVFGLATSLYSISHSVVVFAVVFLFTLAARKRPPWEMGGWLFHILIDIPTHSYQFFPTPVFWPISGWKFSHGISWHQPWFMVMNYSAIALAYWFLFMRPRLESRWRMVRRGIHKR